MSEKSDDFANSDLQRFVGKHRYEYLREQWKTRDIHDIIIRETLACGCIVNHSMKGAPSERNSKCPNPVYHYKIPYTTLNADKIENFRKHWEQPAPPKKRGAGYQMKEDGTYLTWGENYNRAKGLPDDHQWDVGFITEIKNEQVKFARHNHAKNFNLPRELMEDILVDYFSQEVEE